MLEAMGIVMIIIILIALVAWIVWMTMAGAMAWSNDTDIIFLKMDSKQSKAWSEIVDKRLNAMEKQLKIKKNGR